MKKGIPRAMRPREEGLTPNDTKPDETRTLISGKLLF
jgi:hypothetical protein